MSNNLKSWLLLCLLALIWGSSFILMKRGMTSLDGHPIFSDVHVGALRMAIAGTIMLPFGIYYRKYIKHWKQLLSLAVVGFFGNFFPAFLFTFAETKLSSGFAGMLNSFTPFFTLIIGALFFHQKLIQRQVVGLIIAFVGILVLVALGKGLSTDVSWLHIGAIVSATLMYALSLNTIKHTLSGFPALAITALAFSVVSIPAWIVGLITGVPQVIQTNVYASEGLLFIFLLSAVGTCLAVVLFNKIIAMTSAVFASSVTYFIPIVAVLIGAAFNEKVHWLQLIAMLIILVGVRTANTVKK